MREVSRNLLFFEGGVLVPTHSHRWEQVYTLYRDTVVNVALKYISFILQVNNTQKSVNKSYSHAVYACLKSPLTLPSHMSFGIKTNIVLVDEVTIM